MQGQINIKKLLNVKQNNIKRQRCKYVYINGLLEKIKKGTIKHCGVSVPCLGSGVWKGWGVSGGEVSPDQQGALVRRVIPEPLRRKLRSRLKVRSIIQPTGPSRAGPVVATCQTRPLLCKKRLA